MEDKASTKKKLLRAGIKLFAEYGYAATSTRMIATEAGVNLSAISFHFTNKECLYVACLEYVHKKVMDYYESSYAEIEEAFQSDKMDEEAAFHYLGKMIDQQIEVAFNKKYQNTLALIYWENKEIDYVRPLSSAVFERQEFAMARLIMVLAPKITEKQAVLASRQINGSIIAFGEHGNLVQLEEEDYEVDYKGSSWIYDEVKNNCLAIVKNLMNR